MCQGNVVFDKGLCIVCFVKCVAKMGPEQYEGGYHLTQDIKAAGHDVSFVFYNRTLFNAVFTHLRIFVDGRLAHGGFV